MNKIEPPKNRDPATETFFQYCQRIGINNPIIIGKAKSFDSGQAVPPTILRR